MATSVTLQLRGERPGPFLYWAFVALVLPTVGRQLITVLDNQALNRRLASMVGTLEHQAFHDGLTNLPNRALFRGADVAMYTAKARGRGRFELASASA